MRRDDGYTCFVYSKFNIAKVAKVIETSFFFLFFYSHFVDHIVFTSVKHFAEASHNVRESLHSDTFKYARVSAAFRPMSI